MCKMVLSAAVPEVIYDISIIFGLAIIVLLICSKLKIPSVLGFLITGVLAGPDVLHLVKGADDLSVFAEIGIIFLLFSIGIEFSLKDLIKARKLVLIGGGLQLAGTTVISALISYFLGLSGRESLMLGLLFSFSSTAIVLKILQEQGRLNSAQGRASMAILIFQDMAVIPIMLLVPYLSAESGGIDTGFFLLILKAIVTVVLILVMARVIMPKLLFAVAKSKSGELFLMTVLVVCLAVAWLTAEMGLSLSLGAFLAGLVISESDYSHEAFSTIVPFREVFTSFFFISIGLLVDVEYIIQNPLMILFSTIGIMLLKLVLASGAVAFTSRNIRVAIISGLFISQVGEFSFILANAAMPYNLLSETSYQLFLSVSVLSMAITPNMIQQSDRLSFVLNQLLMSKAIQSRFSGLVKSTIAKVQEKTELKDHLIIVGYGDVGRNITKVIKMAHIPFIAIDSDPERILGVQQKRGAHVMYGNATNNQILKHIGVAQARMVVVTISNPSEVKAISLAIRKLAPNCHIIATTKSTHDFSKLFDAGANEIISEQFEISVEVVTRVLSRYMVSRTEIEDFIVRLRQLNYDMERTIRYEQQGIQDYRLEISDTEIITIRVRKDSELANKRLSELKLRSKYNVSVLAVKRGADIVANPDGDLEIRSNDILVIFGTHDSVDQMARL
jgi:monovalent cation:H+ antiporter-2, CPA2 family